MPITLFACAASEWKVTAAAVAVDAAVLGDGCRHLDCTEAAAAVGAGGEAVAAHGDERAAERGPRRR